jgi:hypothetical protein
MELLEPSKIKVQKVLVAQMGGNHCAVYPALIG